MSPGLLLAGPFSRLLHAAVVLLWLAANPATAAETIWQKCADEGVTCAVPGPATVRFGAGDVFVTRVVAGSVACSVDVFGDPLPNVNKICQVSVAAPDPAPPPPPGGTWIACALEGGQCAFAGTRVVRFGASGSYASKTATDMVACDVAVFGDPLFGADKSCAYQDLASAPAPDQWTRCAVEGALCAFTGTRQVRFGAEGMFVYLVASGPLPCVVETFGDPRFGVDKFCEFVAETTMPSAWSPLIDFPIVPVAAANLPNGKILTWSADSPTSYTLDNSRTYSAIFDPRTLQTSQRIVTETGHDMFCPGVSLLADGRILVSGGSTEEKTSIYNPATLSWSVGAPMNVPRGYQTNVTLSSGAVLSLGGSWSGAVGAKDGEIWTAATGWRMAPGIGITPLIAPDPDGEYRGDNHLWLFPLANGRVFHAGPSAAMHWIDTNGGGGITAAGQRADDSSSMNGNSVMYDIGKILKTGGAPAYELAEASAAAYLIDLNAEQVVVRKLPEMHYRRTFHNSVVLPNGQVVLTGGQSYARIFSDDLSILRPELWDPRTEKFSMLSAMSVPRNYHSFSILLADGRVLVGGGGLCESSCSVNHPNGQILTPPYLLNADGSAAARATITAAPAGARNGDTVAIDSDGAIASFVLMRLSSVTHSINSDQRRVPLQFTQIGPQRYQAVIPTDSGTAPKGFYMLFGIDVHGVPTLSRSFKVS